MLAKLFSALRRGGETPVAAQLPSPAPQWVVMAERTPSVTAHQEFVVWNGRWRVLASWLMTKNGLCFCDYMDRPIKGVTHWLQHEPPPEKD